MAWSAVVAGHASRRVSDDSPRVRTIDVDRDELVLSDRKNDSLKAEEWTNLCGHEDAIEEETLGAGTPFIFLYLFGWILGKHQTGWIVGGGLLALIRGILVYMPMRRKSNVGEFWLGDVAMLIMAVAFFYTRVHARTPPGFQGSNGIWLALLLEVVLANTLSCITHIIGLIMDDTDGYPRSRMFLKCLEFGSPIAGLAYLSNVAKTRQATVLRTNNLASRGRRAASESPSLALARMNLMKIMDRSRDLRVTGLNKTELEELAKIFDSRGYKDVAGYIIFFTRKRKIVDTFGRLFAFHRGYVNWIMCRKNNHDISEWVKKLASSSFRSVPSILRVREDGQSLRDVDQDIQPEQRGWWLCGAIASYLDNMDISSASSNNRSWYALTAAVLCNNRNALAMIAARHSAGSIGFAEAKQMWPWMVEGCQQILEHITDDEHISSGRGIVVTGSPNEQPVVTYSAAEVWKAEQGKETVMLDEDTFTKLLSILSTDRPDLPQAVQDFKREILRRNVDMASKAVVRVDFVPTVAHQPVQSRVLANVRATAWRGWFMHFVWVICAIGIHFTFPENLSCSFMFAFFGMWIIRSEVQTHVVYVGFHLWRSWIGRIALLSPFANMDETDIHSMMTSAFCAVGFLVNVVGIYLGTLSGLWHRVCFLAIMIVSVMPGLIYLVFERSNDGVDGSVRYIGRSRGPGYEHRDRTLQRHQLHRPVGKDVIVEIGGNFKIASVSGQDQEVGRTNSDLALGHCW